MTRPVLVLLVILSCGLFFTRGYADDYQLKPRKIAQDTYVLEGVDEDFSFLNGGNILNIGFIVTSQGVLVIDTGPSLLYGEQLRKVIGEVTSNKILRVYNTHLHPDHFLGNQAFAQVPIVALAGTITGMRQQADMFTDNMYRLVGHWMVGTNPLLPAEQINPGTVEIGGHRLSLIELQGHTQADLVIFDHTTGVLFAGDLVFHNRAPTTPHADLKKWIESLDKLEGLAIKTLVPGHGAVADGTGPLLQTRSYLLWLDSTLREQANSGKDMVEVLKVKIPSEFATLAVLPNEYYRSVSHLYGKLERQALQPVTPLDR
ncbi:MAG: quinoprotein relay system zinc metallohydrolase 1 [Gammaproteobacteria bacterium]|nr:quinoprotein relay system zinc metallohydrolase 1 [Gammaproteobacteria bacterium]